MACREILASDTRCYSMVKRIAQNYILSQKWALKRPISQPSNFLNPSYQDFSDGILLKVLPMVYLAINIKPFKNYAILKRKNSFVFELMM